MARTKTEWTRVAFRTFENGEVIALFIDTENLCGGLGNVISYMHNGQHSEADYQHIISCTRRAKVEEYADLCDELHRIGYTNIEVMSRKKK